MALTGCSDSSLTALEPDTDVADTDVVIPSDATSGELLIKFSDEMTEILDRQLPSHTFGHPFDRRGARHPRQLQLRTGLPRR